MAGKAVVPINFLLGDKEIAHVIRDSGIDMVLTAPPLAEKMKVTPLKVLDVAELLAPAPPRHPPPLRNVLAATDLALLMYTSGTSGLPKGVPFTFANIKSGVDGAIMAANFQ